LILFADLKFATHTGSLRFKFLLTCINSCVINTTIYTSKKKLET